MNKTYQRKLVVYFLYCGKRKNQMLFVVVANAKMYEHWLKRFSRWRLFFKSTLSQYSKNDEGPIYSEKGLLIRGVPYMQDIFLNKLPKTKAD